MSSILRLFPRVHQNSTHPLAQNLAHSLVSNRVTRSGHRVLSSLHKRRQASAQHKSRSAMQSKKNDKGLRNKLPQRRSTTKKKKVSILSRLSKKHSQCVAKHSAKQLSTSTIADGKVLRSAPTGCFGARIEDDLCSLQS